VAPNLAKGRNCRLLDVPDEAYFDGRIATKAVAALEDYARSDQPFFLAVGFWKPHSPFNAPKRYWDLYNADSLPPPRPAEWPRDAPRVAWHNSRELVGRGGKPLAAVDVTQMRHGYLAAISYLDAQVGRLLDAIDRLGLAQETIVVFWSDHGYHLGEQTLWAKTSNFELDARVPLIIAVPDRQQAGARVASPVELLDIFPTLIELADLELPERLDGVSLVPLLEKPTTAVKPAALTQHPRPAYYEGAPDVMGYSVRSATHRYTEWRDWQTGETIARELYDHGVDPDETINVAAVAGQAEIVSRHERLLEELGPIVRPGWKPVLP
jgi:iduronate 2-sulfatase